MGRLNRVWAALAVTTALALPAGAEGPTADTVVATVNGTTITLGHMIVMRQTLPEQYQTLPDDVLFKGILDQLVQQETLVQAAGEVAKRDTLTLDNDKRGYLSGVALQKVIEGAVTDAALQAAYDARFKDAAPKTEFSAAHILVDSEAKAAEIKTQIDGGADFAEMARVHSSDGAAQNGGDLGWFGLGMMVKPFEDAVITMKPGEVKGPVQTDFGWHLIKLNETRIATAPALDELRDELAAEIEAKVVEEHIKALTEAAKIEKPGEGIDPSLLRDATWVDK
ncbi:MAG: peptidylprolyl isomerase [Paracoccaceae bacterium]